MSLFRRVEATCPSCGETASFDLVFSLNADRRPDLREQILSGTFQNNPCGKCGTKFRVQPEFNYLDVRRGLWLAAFPLEALKTWQESEQHAQAVFDKSFGARAPRAAREIGRGLTGRITFGWAAVREKVLAFDRKLDDVTLELCKLAMIRSQPDNSLAAETELRLHGFEGDDFVMAWIVSVSERPVDLMRVPRSLYDEIAADEAGWGELRSELSSGLFVDIDKLMVEPVEAASGAA
jgi:hypothetical protein